MKDMLTALAEMQIDRHGITESQPRGSGATFESVHLNLGDTCLDREILPDGSRGQVIISTQETTALGSVVVYRQYATDETGKIKSDNFGGQEYRPVPIGSKAKLFFKLIFGKADQ